MGDMFEYKKETTIPGKHFVICWYRPPSDLLDCFKE